MVTFSEHREYSRSPIHARTEVRLGNGITVEGEAVDVSLRGLMFVSENRLPIGKPVRVMLILDGDAEPRHINAGGHIARLHDEGVAVQFTDIDLDNDQYLRQLVTFNLPQQNQVLATSPVPMKTRKN